MLSLPRLIDERNPVMVSVANWECLSLNQFLVRELETVALRHDIDDWFAEIDALFPEPLPLDDLLDDLRRVRDDR